MFYPYNGKFWRSLGGVLQKKRLLCKFYPPGIASLMLGVPLGVLHIKKEKAFAYCKICFYSPGIASLMLGVPLGVLHIKKEKAFAYCKICFYSPEIASLMLGVPLGVGFKE